MSSANSAYITLVSAATLSTSFFYSCNLEAFIILATVSRLYTLQTNAKSVFAIGTLKITVRDEAQSVRAAWRWGAGAADVVGEGDSWTGKTSPVGRGAVGQGGSTIGWGGSTTNGLPALLGQCRCSRIGRSPLAGDAMRQQRSA
jgi:hypothetical protein